jgi:hypothetical protein
MIVKIDAIINVLCSKNDTLGCDRVLVVNVVKIYPFEKFYSSLGTSTNSTQVILYHTSIIV